MFSLVLLVLVVFYLVRGNMPSQVRFLRKPFMTFWAREGFFFGVDAEVVDQVPCFCELPISVIVLADVDASTFSRRVRVLLYLVRVTL